MADKVVSQWGRIIRPYLLDCQVHFVASKEWTRKDYTIYTEP